MQGYWKKDVTGAMILLERETPTFRARDLSSCEGAALFVHDVRVSALSLLCPLRSYPCPRSTRHPAPPPSPPTLPMRPLALLFRSPSFTLLRRSRRRYGRFDAEERRYQDDDLRQDFFSTASHRSIRRHKTLVFAILFRLLRAISVNFSERMLSD